MTTPPEPREPERSYHVEALAAVLPLLESADFEAGRWHDSEHTANGSWTMPWYDLSDAAMAYVRAVGESGLLLTGFDWPSWAKTPEAKALHGDRDVLAAATPDDLAKLLTALIREDRFNEGALGDSFESGIMTAIAHRAKVLASG
jgi:hypothetical protein